jgi:hypothetical protein
MNEIEGEYLDQHPLMSKFMFMYSNYGDLRIKKQQCLKKSKRLGSILKLDHVKTVTALAAEVYAA